MSYDSYQPPPPGTSTYPARDYRAPPPGLPPRPPPSRGGGDSYRPPSRDRDRDRDRGRGYSYSQRSRDSGNGYNAPPGRSDHYIPPHPNEPPHSSYSAQPPLGRYGSFRPDDHRPPQSDFTFRAEKPAGIQNDQYGNHNSQRSREGAPAPRGRQDRRGDRRGGGQYRGGPYRFLAANRPMLKNDLSQQATQDYGNAGTGMVYKAFGDLSDSDEAEMDISGGSDNDEPSRKRQRTTADQAASDANVPKWSNPDPYTALPPTETSQKKKDVVQLIRKARVQAKETGASVPAGDVDFISCDFDSDSDNDVKQPVEKGNAPPSAPTGPRASIRAPKQGKDKPVPSTQVKPTNPTSNVTSSGNLNPSRKRTHNDQIKLQPPDHARLKKVTKMPAGGIIVYDWRLTGGEEPCPWLKDHSNTPQMGVWLHKEVVDFHDHVKPRDFEQRLRQDMVDTLNEVIRARFPDATVQPFGSFMTGLYLPTGDMDLVLCSRSYLNTGRPKYHTKKLLYQFSGHLQSLDMPFRDEVEIVSKARVPLVKYIDSTTGLKVDISFENITGVGAIQTFLDWKAQYPAMPVLVTVVKHFLTMRGLNEPVNGGIGGFSVICLVVSMLQLMPQVQSRDLVPEHHLGEMLMHFFDLYGNKFNYETTAIRLNPPAYTPKSQVNRVIYKNPDRLSIIDPNNPENDIAGGSSNTPAIARVFSEAHQALQDRMVLLAKCNNSERKNASILNVILEGNYSSFRLQRAHMQRLYDQAYGP